MAGAAIEVRPLFFGGAGDRAELESALARVLLHASETGPEVVFFERYDPELAELMASGRALAVALDERCLREAVVPLLRAGALDVLCANFSGWAERAHAVLDRKVKMDALMESPMVRQNVAGQSRPWRDTLRQIVELSQCEASIMLTGETGTGKELLASLVHGLDPRPQKGGLVILDCTTLVAELSGSELFGHERGAFTGALTARDGVIAQAKAARCSSTKSESCRSGYKLSSCA
jgi:transcriptional regulator of acetoin/glycerol metabolism